MRALIIIVFPGVTLAKCDLLIAWDTGLMKAYLTPGPWKRRVSVGLSLLVAPLVLTCRSSRVTGGSS
jgi:hypothetical protein